MSNTFANFEEKNPFEDPAVLEALKLDRNLNSSVKNTVAQSVDQAIQQAIQGPPHPYNPSSSYDVSAAAELRKKQEELERKAAELQRREEEMQRNSLAATRDNNFPPLPSFCPLRPCFYQDISIDIPLSFQPIVKIGFYLWMGYVIILMINIIGCLFYLLSSVSNNLDNNSGSTFGLSIFLALLFTPSSFVCWFRPLYKAFGKDSSMNFYVFFFIFFFQIFVSIFQTLGISGFGTVGIGNCFQMFGHGSGGSIFTGVIMLLVGVSFGLLVASQVYLIIKVYKLYRSTGASFSKAQEEFASDVVSNKKFQNAAKSMLLKSNNHNNSPGTGEGCSTSTRQNNDFINKY